jgi:hypothetical protein
MITKFLRKRNVNTALEFNKNFARIKVTSSGNTFVFKKTMVQVPAEARILTETDDFLNTEASQRLNIG